MPRPLIALTAVVVVMAIFVGIKDYVQGDQAKPLASTPTAVQSNALSLPRKTTSAKTKPTRISAAELNVPTTATAKTTVENDNAPKTLGAQAAHDEVEPAMDRNNRVRNELDSNIALSPPDCLPLPNGTKLEDVDAPYYKNWAKEYSCQF